MNIFLSATKRNVSVFLSTLFLLFSVTSQAHFIWLDPESGAEKVDQHTYYNFVSGAARTARLYFGEYSNNLFESKNTRLAQRKTSMLKAYFPKAEEGVAIPLIMQHNFYGGIIQTNQYGVVNLVAQDVDSPVSDRSDRGGSITKPMYYARTQWLFFDDKKVSTRIEPATPRTQLDILPITQHVNPRTGDFGPKAGEEVVFQVYFEGKPLTEKPEAVSIFAPNGWTQKVRLDKQGMGRFTPLWKGTYVVEVLYKEQKSGIFKDKNYKSIKHLATLSLTARSKK